MSSKPLPPMQAKFVQEYLLDLNATAAAQRAGYAHPNKQGPRLLVNVGIAAAIAAAQAARAKRVELSADYVLLRLRKQATLYGEGSSHSARVRALELLGKHLGMFPDTHQHQHSGPDGKGPVPIAILEVVKPDAGTDGSNP